MCAYVYQGSNLHLNPQSYQGSGGVCWDMKLWEDYPWATRKSHPYVIHQNRILVMQIPFIDQGVYLNPNWKRKQEKKLEKNRIKDIQFWMQHMISSQLARCICHCFEVKYCSLLEVHSSSCILSKSHYWNSIRLHVNDKICVPTLCSRLWM